MHWLTFSKRYTSHDVLTINHIAQSSSGNVLYTLTKQTKTHHKNKYFHNCICSNNGVDKSSDVEINALKTKMDKRNAF